jgi:hypothetical protein
MQYASHRFEGFLNENFLEKFVLLPKENLYRQSLQCRPKYMNLMAASLQRIFSAVTATCHTNQQLQE